MEKEIPIKLHLSNFINGLKEHSTLSVVIAIVLGFVPFVLGMIYVDEDLYISGRYHIFAQDSFDNYAFLNASAIKLQKSVPNHKTIVLGSSSTRAAINSKVMLSFFEHSEFYKLCSGAQTLWEVLSLVEQIPEQSEGKVILSIGLRQLLRNSTYLSELVMSPRLLVESRGFNAQLRKYNIPIQASYDNFFIDNFRFFFPRMNYAIVNLLTEVPRSKSRYYNKAPMSEDNWQKVGKIVSDEINAQLPINIEENTKLLGLIIKRIQQNTKMKVVIHIPPINPRYIDEFLPDDISTLYQSALDSLSKSYSVPVIGQGQNANLAVSDFYDWTHIRFESVQKKYTESLVLSLNSLSL